MRIPGNVVVNPEKYKYIVLIAAIMGYYFDGIDFVALSLATPLLIQAWGISLADAGLLATSTLIGAAIGAYIWGPIADKIGRTKSLFICLSWFGVMTVLCGLCVNWEQLMIMRFITGLGLGGEWVIGAALVTEFFPPHQRAKATGIVMAAYSLGYLTLLGIQAWLVPTYGWKILFFSGSLTLIGIVYIWALLPESPAWLLAKKNRESGEISDESKTEKVRWLSLFDKSNRKGLILATALCSCILVGYWGANAWLPAYLSTVRGLDIKQMSYYLIVMNICAFIGATFIWGTLADAIGRRWSFVIAGLLSAVVFAVYMNASSPTMVMISGALFGLICLGYWAPLPAFVAEQFPTSLRGAGTSVAYATGRLAAAVAPFIIGGLGNSRGLGFAMMLVTVVYFIGAIIPIFMKETKTLKIAESEGLEAE